MFGFGKKQPTSDSASGNQRQVDLVAGAYRRWLRAQRPPFEWFMVQDEDSQEWMAMLGDQYVAGVAEDVTAQAKQAVTSEEETIRGIAKATLSAMRDRKPGGGGNGVANNGWPRGGRVTSATNGKPAAPYVQPPTMTTPAEPTPMPAEARTT